MTGRCGFTHPSNTPRAGLFHKASTRRAQASTRRALPTALAVATIAYLIALWTAVILTQPTNTEPAPKYRTPPMLIQSPHTPTQNVWRDVGSTELQQGFVDEFGSGIHEWGG